MTTAKTYDCADQTVSSAVFSWAFKIFWSIVGSPVLNFSFYLGLQIFFGPWLAVKFWNFLVFLFSKNLGRSSQSSFRISLFYLGLQFFWAIVGSLVLESFFFTSARKKCLGHSWQSCFRISLLGLQKCLVQIQVFEFVFFLGFCFFAP